MNWEYLSFLTCSASEATPPDTIDPVAGSKPICPDKYIVLSTITAWLQYNDQKSYWQHDFISYIISVTEKTQNK